MKCLILAAGYATRLYPLTENFPKPLLTVKDQQHQVEKTILDWLVDDLASTGEVDEFILISNHRYVQYFEDWKQKKQQETEPAQVKYTVLDDGTDSNDNRLGAVKDIQFAIDTLKIQDDILVAAGDNILDFSLTRLLTYAQEKQTSCIMRYYEPSEEKLQKCGVVLCDADDRVLSMEEKPEKPKSHWCCPPFYYYTGADTKLIKTGIEARCGTDAPGSFMAWLCGQTPVYAMKMPGRRYDIGDIKSYEAVQESFRGIVG